MEILGQKAKQAFRHIRNYVMQYGRTPSVRELMVAMEYKSPRSAVLLMEELEENGYLGRKIEGGYILIKDIEGEEVSRTVSIPLVGTVTCGVPILAHENIEALIPVSTLLIQSGSKYFLLRAKGDSMDEAGIYDGDLILVKQQPTAENGQNVVALIDDEATVKEYRHQGKFVTLLPKSSNRMHQPIILTSDFKIQGIVIAAIPKSIS